MNYTSSHLANKRLQEQSKDIGSICNTLDNMIDRVDNILLFIDTLISLGISIKKIWL